VQDGDYSDDVQVCRWARNYTVSQQN